MHLNPTYENAHAVNYACDLAVPYSFLQRGSGEGGADHLSRIQWWEVWEWFKVSPAEIPVGHKEAFLYQKGGQTLQQDS